ncbi:hypothetical protein EG329_012946 [Mollisiaceae sp. DMI_Dod_QoI]|nr:hypothetical protein EG329_012946 [Helotiales sp. DMI_Dod_QoI]
MMLHQYHKLFLSLLFFTSLLDIVCGSYIPFRKPEDAQQHSEGKSVSPLDLENLGKYICNRIANLLKRQSGPDEITLSVKQLETLLADLRLAEKWLLELLGSKVPPILSEVVNLQTVTAMAPALSPAAYTPDDLTTTLITTISIPSTTTEWKAILPETILPQSSIIEAISAPSSTLLPPIDTPPLPSAIPDPLLGSFTTSATDSMPTNPPPTPVPAPIAESSTANSISTVDPIPTNLAADNYKFNPLSSTNIAVYYGQSPLTSTTTLTSQCADPNIDIVVLAFVISQLDGGKYPSVNFGAACGGQTAMMTSEAPGLLWCPALASMIETCQTTYGKKVFLSVGGAASSISFTGTNQAKAFATTLWNVFGPTGNVDADLRPFGDVIVDGFDIDNEDSMPAHFDVVASTLRNKFAQAKDKSYYLSSAPQCPFPDASDPMPMILLCDFVWVQFYNNPGCEIGSADFNASVHQWSHAIDASTLARKPKFYLGAPAWSAAGPTAYAGIGSPEGMKGVVQSVESMRLDNFGGVMFWDGPEGVANTEGGKDIISWTKEGLMA